MGMNIGTGVFRASNNGVGITDGLRPTTSRGRSIVGLVLGVIFVVIGGYMVLDTQKTASWSTANTTVTNLATNNEYDSEDGQYHTYYSYDLVYVVNGTTYTHRVNRSTSTTSNGQTGVLRYDPDNLSDVRVGSVASASWTAWIFIGVGAVVTLVSLVMSIVGRSKTAASAVSQISPTAPVQPGYGVPIPQAPVAPQGANVEPSPYVGNPTDPQ